MAVTLLWPRLFICLLLIGLQGCASTSLFNPYPNQINPLLEQVDQGSPPELNKLRRRGANGTLHLLEAGRLAQIQGDREASIRFFERALDDIAQQEQEALLRLSGAGELGTAMLINDNALSYQTTFYERAMAHAFQALNYLYLRDLEAAGVEARRANLVDIALTNAYERRLLEAQQEPISKLSDEDTQDILEARLYAMNQRAAQVKSSYTTAYAYFVSGLIYELRGEINAAYIDYKKALELNRENPVLLQSALRWAQQLGFREDLELLSQLAAQQGISAVGVAPDQAEIVVLYEQNWTATKIEESIAIPVGDRLITLALPVYRHFIDPSPLLIGSYPEHQQTYLVTDFQALAARALSDQHTVTLARQIARAAAKHELQHSAEKHAGPVGLFAALIYTLLSESADLRSWLSLPAYSHIARWSVAAGEHRLRLTDALTGQYAELEIALKPREKAIIQVINTGTRLYIHQTQIL